MAILVQPQSDKSAQASKLRLAAKTKMMRKLPPNDKRRTQATMTETRSNPLLSVRTRVRNPARQIRRRWQRESKSVRGRRRKRLSAGSRRKRAKKQSRQSVSSPS